jgi:toxin ParE1/3/4
MAMIYKLTPLALNDLKAIWHYGAKTWGLEQAEAYGEKVIDAFEFLAENPHAGKDMAHIRAGYRRIAVGSHLIFYQVLDDVVQIVRILHKRMDTEQQLKH